MYTDSNFGFDGTIGINRKLSDSISLGIVADYTGAFVDSGWDRYGTFTSQSSKLVSVPAGGLKFEWRMTDTVAFDAIALEGKHGFGGNVGLAWRF